MILYVDFQLLTAVYVHLKKKKKKKTATTTTERLNIRSILLSLK